MATRPTNKEQYSLSTIGGSHASEITLADNLAELKISLPSIKGIGVKVVQLSDETASDDTKLPDRKITQSKPQVKYIEPNPEILHWRWHEIILLNSHKNNFIYAMTGITKSEMIDEGAYGKVYIGYDFQTEKKYVIKELKDAQDDGTKAFMTPKKGEISALHVTPHPSIVQTYALILHKLSPYSAQNTVYQMVHHKDQLEQLEDYTVTTVIEEYFPHKSLFDYMNNHKGDSHTPSLESLALNIGVQIAEALLHMHRCRVIHRDIKPENILIDPETLQIKIIDFGLSKPLLESMKTSTPCGSNYYTAPEALKSRSYDFKLDSWGLGYVLCLIMCKNFPAFLHITRHKIGDLSLSQSKKYILRFAEKSNAEKKQYILDNLDRTHIDVDSKLLDFCTYLLNIDPEERPSMETAAKILRSFKIEQNKQPNLKVTDI